MKSNLFDCFQCLLDEIIYITQMLYSSYYYVIQYNNLKYIYCFLLRLALIIKMYVN
jgi:hypothetical protein